MSNELKAMVVRLLRHKRLRLAGSWSEKREEQQNQGQLLNQLQVVYAAEGPLDADFGLNGKEIRGF